jgi:phytanoyl-CoA hydroxylase
MDPAAPPFEYSQEEGIPLEVPPGSIIVFHGSFLHWSKANTSPNQRHAYTLHVIEGKNKFSDQNWIRRGDESTCEGVVFRDIEM